VLTAETLAGRSGTPTALVVVDGTWAQASHMVRRIRPLRAMPAVRLPAGPPGIWTIRRARQPEHLCTLEAVIRAVGISGFPREAEALQTALTLIHERLWAMREGRVGPGSPFFECGGRRDPEMGGTPESPPHATPEGEGRAEPNLTTGGADNGCSCHPFRLRP